MPSANLPTLAGSALGRHCNLAHPAHLRADAVFSTVVLGYLAVLTVLTVRPGSAVPWAPAPASHETSQPRPALWCRDDFWTHEILVGNRKSGNWRAQPSSVHSARARGLSRRHTGWMSLASYLGSPATSNDRSY